MPADSPAISAWTPRRSTFGGRIDALARLDFCAVGSITPSQPSPIKGEGSKNEVRMSVQARPKRLSGTQIQGHKGGDKLVCLTAYTASVARHLDHEVDLLLVGDSLGMVVYGFDSTLPASLDMM